MQRASSVKFLGLFLLWFPGIAYAVEALDGGLPEGPRRQLNMALKAWNENYGAHVRAVRWSVRGKIGTENLSFGAIREDMTNPARAWIPDIDTYHPENTRAVRLDRSEGIGPDAIKSWKLSTDKAVQEDAKYYIDIDWEQDGKPFRTTAVASQDKLLYDSMIFNSRLVKKHNSCFYTAILWLWGDISGEITADAKLLCEGRSVTSCDKACTAWMDLGDAKVECDSNKVSTTACQMKYVWAWGTPLASISFKKDSFEFKVTGIGSRGNGNGSCSLTCP